MMILRSMKLLGLKQEKMPAEAIQEYESYKTVDMDYNTLASTIRDIRDNYVFFYQCVLDLMMHDEKKFFSESKKIGNLLMTLNTIEAKMYT